METRDRLLVAFCDTPTAYAGKDAYAHPALWGATTSHNSRILEWNDVEFTGYDDSGSIPIINFEYRAQVDDRKAEMYAGNYGYKPKEHREIITVRDIARYSKPLMAIDRYMTRAYEQHGPSKGFGDVTLRLARALKVQAIVVMPSRPWRGDTSPVHVWRMDDKPGQAIWYLDKLVTDAHAACAKLVGKEPVSSISP